MKSILVLLVLLTTAQSFAGSFAIFVEGKNYICSEGDTPNDPSTAKCKVISYNVTDAETGFTCGTANYCPVLIKYGVVYQSWNMSTASEAVSKCDEYK